MNQDDTQKDIHEEESVDTDELVFEEETENTAPDLAKKIRTLQKKVADLEAKNAELLLNWQKDKADFVNLRRKDEEAKKDIISFARKNMVAEVLPVLESFESAMKNKEVWEKVDHNWRVGVEYIFNQLYGILKNYGLQKIEALGQTFDPRLHEAVSAREVGEGDHNKVLEVVRSGYTIGDTVLEPARVIIGEYKG